MGPAGWYDPPGAPVPLQDIDECQWTGLFYSKSSKFSIVALVLATGAAGYTEAPAVAKQLHGVLIHSHQTDGVYVGENATVESTGSHLSEPNETKLKLKLTF